MRPAFVRRYSSLPNIRCATANSSPTATTYTIVVEKALTGHAAVPSSSIPTTYATPSARPTEKKDNAPASDFTLLGWSSSSSRKNPEATAAIRAKATTAPAAKTKISKTPVSLREVCRSAKAAVMLTEYP